MNKMFEETSVKSKMGSGSSHSPMPNHSEQDRLHQKASRAGHKAAVTKKINELYAITKDKSILKTEDNIAIVKKNLSKLHELFSNFTRSHELYMSLLQETDTEYERSLDYAREIDRLRNNCVLFVNNWLLLEDDQVRPEDSISQVKTMATGISRSSQSSTRRRIAEEEAEQRALEVKMKMLEQERQIKERQLELQRKYEAEKIEMEHESEQLKLRSLFKQSEARQKVLRKQENEEHSEVFSDITKCKKHMSQACSLTSEQENKIFVEAFTSLSLPSIDVPTFSGDPIQYTSFITAFENLIETKTQLNSKRLYYLTQYTKGNANELVRSFLHDPENSYFDAKKRLEKIYGQPYCIATAYVDKITKGGPIKSEDPTALRNYSILLESCQNALQKIGYMNKIENPDCMRKIILRLPTI